MPTPVRIPAVRSIQVVGELPDRFGRRLDLVEGALPFLARGRAEELFRACQNRIDLVGGFVQLLGDGACLARMALSTSGLRSRRVRLNTSALSTVLPILAGSMALAMLLMSASAVSSLGAEFVEPPHEGSRIRQGLADIVAAVAQAGGEIVHVLDDAGHALAVDGAHHLVDIGREGLELLGQRPDLLGRLPDLGQEAVDPVRVLAQRLRELLDVLDGPVDASPRCR